MRIVKAAYVIIAWGLALLAGPVAASAQAGAPVRWDIDPVRSMIWWQVNPHFGHLWATTCPEDPTWQAGEGRSSQHRGQSSLGRRVRQTNVKETEATIPLFPRDTVRANCRNAVSGALTMRSAGSSGPAAGTVSVRADSLVIGSDMRDAFAKKYVYKTGDYKEIKFSVDSVASVQTRNDTTYGIAHGVFQLRDAKKEIAVPFYAVNDPAGLRVRGKWHMTAPELVKDYHVPRTFLAMGVATKLWDELHMGFDLVLRRAAGS